MLLDKNYKTIQVNREKNKCIGTTLHINSYNRNTIYVMNLFLRVGDKNNPCIRVTQENLIENSVQDSLPYI